MPPSGRPPAARAANPSATSASRPTSRAASTTRWARFIGLFIMAMTKANKAPASGANVIAVDNVAFTESLSHPSQAGVGVEAGDLHIDDAVNRVTAFVPRRLGAEPASDEWTAGLGRRCR